MAGARCPFCGCHVFYVKDSYDEYHTHEFDCLNGRIHFIGGDNASPPPEIDLHTRIFCNQCSWHGPFEESQKN